MKKCDGENSLIRYLEILKVKPKHLQTSYPYSVIDDATGVLFSDIKDAYRKTDARIGNGTGKKRGFIGGGRPVKNIIVFTG